MIFSMRFSLYEPHLHIDTDRERRRHFRGNYLDIWALWGGKWNCKRSRPSGNFRPVTQREIHTDMNKHTGTTERERERDICFQVQIWRLVGRKTLQNCRTWTLEGDLEIVYSSPLPHAKIPLLHHPWWLTIQLTSLNPSPLKTINSLVEEAIDLYSLGTVV